MPIAEARARGQHVCQGWRREVSALTRTGYYKDRAPLKKDFAAIGIVQLKVFVDSEPGTDEKSKASELLGFIVEELQKLRIESEA